MTSSYVLTPLRDAVAEELRRSVIQYWTAIAQSDDLGGALGERVRETEVAVTELLQSGSLCDLYEAQRVTAQFEYERQLFS